MNRFGFYTLVLIAVLGPLCYGSTGPFAGPALAFLAVPALLAGQMSPAPNHAAVSLSRRTLAVAGVVAAAALLQSLPVWDGFPSNPIWSAAGEFIDPGQGNPITVAAFEPLHALGYVLAPLLTFAAAVLIVRDDQGFQRLWGVIIAASVVVTLATLGLYWTFPKMLLLEQKLAYLGSFTGPFVNRNTAATYFATLFLMSAAMSFSRMRELRLPYVIDNSRYLTPKERVIFRDFLLFCAAALIFGIALLLTKSRAGIACFFLAAAGLLVWMILQRRKKPGALILGAGVSAGILFVFLSGQMLTRLAARDPGEDERWCSYAATFEAIKDNFWLGTGLGTFENVFPAYRICGISRVWDMAHSTYLEGLLTLGAIFIPLVLYVFWKLIATYRTGLKTRRRMRYAPAACLAVLALIALHSAIDFPLQVMGYAMFAAVVLGSGAAVSLHRKQN